MKKPKVFFNPISGTGILSLTWSKGPLGDAVEANKGDGIGYFSESDELLGVMFDDVSEKSDHQLLDFDSVQVEAWVKAGKVKFEVYHSSRENKKRA